MKIKVLIAEDMVSLLKRYQKAVDADPNIEVVAAVKDGYEAVMMTAVCRPDVILMDIEMESRTAGFDASRQILEKYPETKIVILTIFEDEETIFHAFQLGVVDYILKSSQNTELVQCVKDAYNNCSPIRPVIAEKIRREFRRVKNKEEKLLNYVNVATDMTMTELAVLELFRQGKTRSEICRIRNVEISTIKSQVKSILRKFKMERVEEVLEALESISFFDSLFELKKEGIPDADG